MGNTTGVIGWAPGREEPRSGSGDAGENSQPRFLATPPIHCIIFFLLHGKLVWYRQLVTEAKQRHPLFFVGTTCSPSPLPASCFTLGRSYRALLSPSGRTDKAMCFVSVVDPSPALVGGVHARCFRPGATFEYERGGCPVVEPRRSLATHTYAPHPPSHRVHRPARRGYTCTVEMEMQQRQHIGVTRTPYRQRCKALEITREAGIFTDT
jgi:hypothetical protein